MDQAEKDLQAVIQAAGELLQEALRPEIHRDEFFRRVMARTLELVDFDMGWLLLRSGDWAEIVMADPANQSDIGLRWPVSDCVSGLCMEKGEVICLPDLKHAPDEYQKVYKGPASGREMRSELTAPLMVGQEAIGAFNVESEKIGGFTARHIEILKLLSGQVALAVELANLRDESNALSRFGLELSRQAEMKDVVRALLNQALALVFKRRKDGDRPRGYGQVVLREGEKLVIRWTTNAPQGGAQPDDLDEEFDIDDCNSGLTIKERRPVIFPDVGQLDYYAVEFVDSPVGRKARLTPRRAARLLYKRTLERDKEAVQAEFAVPLFWDGAVTGVLNVETSRQTGFTGKQRDDLQAFVQANAERFATALTALEQPRLMELLAGALARVDAKFGQILRVEGDRLVIEQTTGGEAIYTHVTEKSVTGRAWRRGAPEYVPDVASDPDYHRYLGEEMKSELVVPLILESEVVGLLNMESPTPGFFTADHARLLEPFAGQAAVAIERANRLENITLAEVGGLAGDIVHQLNNPLGAISARLELLKGKPFYPDMLAQYPDLKRFVERTERDLNSAKATIQELRPALKEKPLSPVALLPSLWEALAKVDLPPKTSVQWPPADETLQVLANRRLPKVFWNLFDNACKAMPEGGTLTITLDLSEDGQWVAVGVKDTGGGIAPWRLDLIFDRGESTTKDAYAPGHGLGLWWTKAQVEGFGGTITAQSEVGAGATFTVKLRRAR